MGCVDVWEGVRAPICPHCVCESERKREGIQKTDRKTNQSARYII